MTQNLQAIIEDADKYKDYLLDMMIDNGASDMYLTYNEPPCLRIMDKVHKINQLPPFDEYQLKEMAYMFMDDFEGETFRENLDIDLGWSHNGKRFRINVSRQKKTIMIVIRLLSEKIPTVDELGLPHIFKDLVGNSNWIILLAGPTGSGKSTTLASMIEEVNINYPSHIITIEDPIEYVFQAKKAVIEQKQLGIDIRSFARGLKSALRQKPDVILFGEMRDLESIQNAITLAETGHLVLSTIHSKSAGQTISKILDAFPSDQQNQVRIQLSDTLLSVISQRLMRKKWGKWMVSAHEIMINNSAISNLIRDNQIKQINNIIQTSKGSWMQILEENLISLFENWSIDYQTALAYSNDPEYIQSEIKNRWIVVNDMNTPGF